MTRRVPRVSEVWPAPRIVHVSYTQGCTIGCRFCGASTVRVPDWMTERTLEQLARRLAEEEWNGVVLIGGQGEPTHHPEWYHYTRWLSRVVSQTPGWHPCVTLSMDAHRLTEIPDVAAMLWSLFESGMHRLSLGVGRRESDDAARAMASLVADLSGALIGEYPGNGSLDPGDGAGPARRIVFNRAPVQTNFAHRLSRSNSGGVLPDPPLNRWSRRSTPCAKVGWEIHVRPDGTVTLCDEDWRSVHVLGSIHQSRLSDIWRSPTMDAIRRAHWHGERQRVLPCARCTRTTWINGRRNLPVPETPTDETRRLVQESQGNPPGVADAPAGPLTPRQLAARERSGLY